MELTTNSAMINNNKISYFKQLDAFSPFASEENLDFLLVLDQYVFVKENYYQVTDVNEYDDCVIYTVKLIKRPIM